MIRLTTRGAVVLTGAVFTLGVLLAGWFGLPALAGVFFLAGSAAAVWWARKADLLLVALSPPTVLCVVLIVISALTGSGGLMVSVAEGTTLTLVGAAPWLFAGTALALIIAAARALGGSAWPLRQLPARPAGQGGTRRRDPAEGQAGRSEREPDVTRV